MGVVRLRKRIVYRGEVYNAIEAARINALDGILTDRYKDGFHDGLKRALEILANEVEDVHVPPHGRLVDADVLKDLYHYNTHDSDIDKAWTGNIRRSIDSAPTVIEAEEGE